MQEHLSNMRKTLGLIPSTENTPTPTEGSRESALQWLWEDWGQMRDPRVSSYQGSRKIQADATTQMAQLGQRPRKLQAWAGHEWSLVVLAQAWHLPICPAGDSPRRALQMVRGFPRSSLPALPAHALAERQTWHCSVFLRNENMKFREDK